MLGLFSSMGLLEALLKAFGDLYLILEHLGLAQPQGLGWRSPIWNLAPLVQSEWWVCSLRAYPGGMFRKAGHSCPPFLINVSCLACNLQVGFSKVSQGDEKNEEEKIITTSAFTTYLSAFTTYLSVPTML